MTIVSPMLAGGLKKRIHVSLAQEAKVTRKEADGVVFVVLLAIVALTMPPQGNRILKRSYDRCIVFNLRA